MGSGAERSSLPHSVTIFRVSVLPIALSPTGPFALLNSALHSQGDTTARACSDPPCQEGGETSRAAPGAAWLLLLPSKCPVLRGFPSLTSEKIQIGAAKPQAKYYPDSDLCLAGVLTASSKQVLFYLCLDQQFNKMHKYLSAFSCKKWKDDWNGDPCQVLLPISENRNIPHPICWKGI